MSYRGMKALLAPGNGDEVELVSKKYRRAFRNPHCSWKKAKRTYNRRVRRSGKREARDD